MKITQEDFNKLPQLDRIEFRQRRDYLDNHRIHFNPISFMTSMIYLCLFVILIAFVVYNINPDSTIRLLNVVPSILKIGIIVSLALLVLDIIEIFSHRRAMNELLAEYFSQKTEVKNGKRRL